MAQEDTSHDVVPSLPAVDIASMRGDHWLYLITLLTGLTALTLATVGDLTTRLSQSATAVIWRSRLRRWRAARNDRNQPAPDNRLSGSTVTPK